MGKIVTTVAGVVILERAVAAQAASIAVLHGRLFPEPWTADSIATLLDQPTSVSFIARAGDLLEPVGFLLGRLAADESEVLSLGVRVDMHRCGIGQSLMSAFLAAAREQGARRLFLEVGSGNFAARRFYERLGFVQAGRRPRYYQRPGGVAEDALMLTMVLPQPPSHCR
ncbi:MAG TPA: GNAT family N-acetyltransferase [Hyphomicrobiaceae bacterium]|nr:GNAT family N-acetyltransferase [Hyphomicrobiaceae bacterium]